MALRPLPLLGALFLMVAGCAAPTTESEQEDVFSDESALRTVSLREFTALDRAQVIAGTAGEARVDYAPAPNANPHDYSRSVAFEAVTFRASPTASRIAVAGDFPSSALVVVTDENFQPLAATRTTRVEADLSAASVRVPAGDGQRFVLIRDPKWVKPMQFEVHVGVGR